MTIYYLDPLRTSLVSIPCERLKYIHDVKSKIISDKKHLSEAFDILNDRSNFAIDSTQKYLDSRIEIIFTSKDRIIETFCWLIPGRIKFGDYVYKYNEKVEDFLVSEKLIYKLKKKPSH